MSDNEPNREVLFRQPISTTIIQIVSVIGTLAVLVIMYCQLDAIRDEQSIALRPYLSIETEASQPGLTQVFEMKNTAQENEMWKLGYWVANTGDYPARNIHYRIEHSTSSRFDDPSTFDNEKPIMLNPSIVQLVTTKSMARSEAIESQAKNATMFRHIYVKYEDDSGNSYYTNATWGLRDYKVSGPINWYLVSMNGN